MGLADRPEKKRLGADPESSGGVVRENPNEGAGQGCARPTSEPSLQHRVWVSRFNRTSRNPRLLRLVRLPSLWLSGLGHSEHRHCASPLSRRSPGGFVRARFLSGGGRRGTWPSLEASADLSIFLTRKARNDAKDAKIALFSCSFALISTRPATGNLHLVNWVWLLVARRSLLVANHHDQLPAISFQLLVPVHALSSPFSRLGFYMGIPPLV